MLHNDASVSQTKAFPAPSLNMVSKVLTLITTHWTEKCGPWL